MKYLKSFFIKESNRDYLEEIKTFCTNSLVYLIDEGFNIEVNYYTNHKTKADFVVRLTKPSDVFEWSDYKDDLIQFIDYLYDTYECGERISIIDKFNSSTQLKIASDGKIDVNLEEIEINKLISAIFFYIEIEL